MNWKKTAENRSRAAIGQKMLDAMFSRAHQKTEKDAVVVDAVTDLLHFAAKTGYDVEDVLSMARNHFECERAGEEV